MIGKNPYLATLALASPRRNSWSRAQTSIFIIENQHFLVQMAPQASWPSSMPLGLQNYCSGSRAGVMMFSFFLLGFQHPSFPDSQISRFKAVSWHVSWPTGLPSHLEPNMLIFYRKYCCLSSRPPVSSRRDENKCHPVRFWF